MIIENIKLGRLLGRNSGCINVVRAGSRFVLELRELFDGLTWQSATVQSDGAASEEGRLIYIKKA